MIELESQVVENWSQVRLDRGLSWEQLAVECRKHGHDDIAAWAERNAEGDKSARASSRSGRAVKRVPEKRG